MGAYIGAAYFFTSSTSFANPAITVGRMFSNTFAGIAPTSVPAFVIAQLVGGLVAIGALRTLYPDITPEEAAEIMAPTSSKTPHAPKGSWDISWYAESTQPAPAERDDPVLVVGGSDAGVSAVGREVDPESEVHLLVADRWPNYSICGLPYLLSGEVSDPEDLAHRRGTELNAAGLRVHLEHRAVAVDVGERSVIAEIRRAAGDSSSTN